MAGIELGEALQRVEGGLSTRGACSKCRRPIGNVCRPSPLRQDRQQSRTDQRNCLSSMVTRDTVVTQHVTSRQPVFRLKIACCSRDWPMGSAHDITSGMHHRAFPLNASLSLELAADISLDGHAVSTHRSAPSGPLVMKVVRKNSSSSLAEGC